MTSNVKAVGLASMTPRSSEHLPTTLHSSPASVLKKYKTLSKGLFAIKPWSHSSRARNCRLVSTASGWVMVGWQYQGPEKGTVDEKMYMRIAMQACFIRDNPDVRGIVCYAGKWRKGLIEALTEYASNYGVEFISIDDLEARLGQPGDEDGITYVKPEHYGVKDDCEKHGNGKSYNEGLLLENVLSSSFECHGFDVEKQVYGYVNDVDGARFKSDMVLERNGKVTVVSAKRQEYSGTAEEKCLAEMLRLTNSIEEFGYQAVLVHAGKDIMPNSLAWVSDNRKFLGVSEKLVISSPNTIFSVLKEL